MLLFMDPSGPRIAYGDGVIYIDDLNPQHRLAWRMTRWELAKLGLKAIWAAMWAEDV